MERHDQWQCNLQRQRTVVLLFFFMKIYKADASVQERIMTGVFVRTKSDSSVTSSEQINAIAKELRSSVPCRSPLLTRQEQSARTKIQFSVCCIQIYSNVSTRKWTQMANEKMSSKSKRKREPSHISSRTPPTPAPPTPP